MLFQGVERQSGIGDRVGLPVDVIAESSYASDITSETVQLYYFSSTVPTIDAGQAAGTVVVAKLKYQDIMDRLGGMIGNNLETSLVWTTGTVLPIANIKPCPKEYLEDDSKKTLYEIATAITENFATGEWCLEHRTGYIFGKKATTGVSDTAAYKVQTAYSSGGGGVATDINLSEVATVAVSAKDAPFAEPPLGIGGEYEALGSLTTDAGTAGDKIPFKGTNTGILYIQHTNGTQVMPTGDDPARRVYVSSSSTASTLASTTALAASLVIKASAGVLLGISGINNSASAQYIQVHNTASLPADTAIPVIVIKVDAGENFFYSPTSPITMGTGITVSNSSTLATKTIGSADCWIQAEYI